MRKRVVSKGNMRRGDMLRVVLTDTLPEEIPIIFSNDGFYKNRSNNKPLNTVAREFVDALLTADRRYTKPYRYNVLRDGHSARRLSLIHPSSQIDVARFYQKYDTLICYYCSKSGVTLRAPQKVGTTFFVKSLDSERNQYRTSTVDTVSLENTVSNPASYFSYNKISRAHEFFSSMDYFHLEKKFNIFRTVDVSKCFSSIYTHTLYWATSDIETAKDNTGSSGFANDFDRIMQSMNYNETSGICVGPEVSRIFAEVILGKIDTNIVEYLRSRDMLIKTHYDFRRYVDDFYIFADTDIILNKVTAAITTCLSEFNLHINEEKTSTISRPFATKKSQIIADTNAALTDFLSKIIAYREINDEPVAVPKYVHRSDSLVKFMLNSIKAICVRHESEYSDVSDYIVSALYKRVVELDAGRSQVATGGAVPDDNYISCVTLIVELVFFFYTVNPTVRASLNVARVVIMSTRMFRDNFPTRLHYLSENVVRWTLDLVQSINRKARHKDLTAVPVEVLNIVIPLKEIADDETLVDDLIDALCMDVSLFEYFEIVTFIFMMGGKPRHRKSVNRLFVRGKEIAKESLGPRADSQTAHLCLDLLTCPFIPVDKRASWLNNMRSKVGIAKVPVADAQAAINSMSFHHWFVGWEHIDLLSLLRKKELSAVY